MSTSRNTQPRVVQIRTTIVLMGAQLIGGTGLAAAVTVGGIIGAELGGPTVTGLPLAAAVAGTALSALALGALMQRHGRRLGLRWGWLIGGAGATLAIAATSMRSFALLLLAMLLFGGGEAASTAARFAATDLAGRRGAAMGIVLSATAVSTTLGSTLVSPAARLASQLDLPALTGPFLLSSVAFVSAAAIIGLALRPDPLLLARKEQPHVPEPTRPGREAVRLLLRGPARRGLAAVTTANLVMLGIMTIAPVHVAHTSDGAPTSALPGVGLLLGLHLAGMYAPSPLTGWLADRIGSHRVIALGGAVLAIAGLLVTRSADRAGLLVVALTLLGVGWNLAFMGGSLSLLLATNERQRPRVQAAADATMSVAGMAGSASSGIVLAVGGLATAGALGAVLAGALTLSALTWRSAPPNPSAPKARADGPDVPHRPPGTPRTSRHPALPTSHRA